TPFLRLRLVASLGSPVPPAPPQSSAAPPPPPEHWTLPWPSGSTRRLSVSTSGSTFTCSAAVGRPPG
ncbi:hypothetical protein M9458_021879, partial [Cirrhinus mrigala]